LETSRFAALARSTFGVIPMPATTAIDHD
jgi:hypothetical protein